MHGVMPGAGGLSLDPRPGADGQGYVWGLGVGANEYMSFGLPDVFQRFVFSCRIFMGNLPPELGMATIFRLWEDEEDSAFDVQIYPDGSFGNSEPCLVTGAWQLVECMMGAGDDYHGFELRVDGETVIYSATGGEIHRPELPKMPSYFWKILNSGAPSWLAIKDFVLQYGHSAEFLGPCNVRELQPIADVSSGWTLTGAASEHAALDNAPPDGAQYIAAPDPIPAPSVTTIGGLHANTKAIGGLVLSLYMRSDNGGAVQSSLVESGTPRAGGVKNPLDAARFYADIFATDPDTGLPWEPAVVAGLSLSINRTA
jgi:hypothetical protein